MPHSLKFVGKMCVANILAQKSVCAQKQSIGGVPPDDDQSCTKVEHQGIIILPAYFENKLVVYQIAPHIQEWQVIPPELETQCPKNQESFP
jgi:hypothetical protein